MNQSNFMKQTKGMSIHMNNVSVTPFISTPLSPTSENTQMTPTRGIPAPGVTQPVTQAHTVSPQPEDMENLYPDIYRELYPAIMDAVKRMSAAGYAPTPDAIGSIVDNIIKNSGLWYEDEDDEPFDRNPEAVPVQLGFGRGLYRRRRRRHHNRNTLRDIVRILLLREMFSGGNTYPYPYY